jgi:hypothetical protein
LSSSFDSGDPLWTSQIVAAANSANWRYSDCQFSVTAWAKLAVDRYCHSEINGSPCVAASSL